MQEQHTIIAVDFMQLAVQEILRCDASLSNAAKAKVAVFYSNVVSCLHPGVFTGKGVVARWTSTLWVRGVTVSPSRGVVVQRDPTDNESQTLSKYQCIRFISDIIGTFEVWKCV